MSDVQCPARIILARHGEAAYETEMMTESGGSLTTLGRAQARALGDRLRHERVATVVCSELARAVQTAEIAAGVLGLPVRVREGLQEFPAGDFQGQHYDHGFFDEMVRSWLAGDLTAGVPGGETGRETADRVLAVLDGIADECRGETVLVVSHGGVILSLWGAVAPGSAAAPASDLVTNCSTYVLERDADGWAGLCVVTSGADQGVTVAAGARRVLDSTWRETDRFCPPNPQVYPHQWLWDSCFHAIAWSALGDPRGARELAACFEGQLEGGFVPHMRYLGPSTNRGPLPDRSSFTQPPVYAHAARVLEQGGADLGPDLVGHIVAALDWLWDHRRTPEGLLYVVHPWETGTDDSPRWDDWVGLPAYDHAAYSAYDRMLVGETYFDNHGAAVWSRSCASAPASFNALAAHAATECAVLTGDDRWRVRGEELAAVADDLLWDEQEGLWVDRPLIGGGAACRIPTLDGALGALVTGDAAKAERVLGQLADAERFGAPYGLAYLPRRHPAYDPGSYWRGPAWPQLNYLMAVAAARWRDDATYARVREMTFAGVLRSDFAEYWNPEDGRGLGAVPQGWAAVAAAL